MTVDRYIVGGWPTDISLRVIKYNNVKYSNIPTLIRLYESLYDNILLHRGLVIGIFDVLFAMTITLYALPP